MRAARKILKAGLKASYWHGYTKATVKAKKTQWAHGMKNTKLKTKNIFKRKRQPSLAELGFFSGLGGATGGAIGGSVSRRNK